MMTEGRLSEIVDDCDKAVLDGRNSVPTAVAFELIREVLDLRRVAALAHAQAAGAGQRAAVAKAQRDALTEKLRRSNVEAVAETVKGATTEMSAGKSLAQSYRSDWNQATDRCISILKQYGEGNGLFQQLSKSDLPPEPDAGSVAIEEVLRCPDCGESMSVTIDTEAGRVEDCAACGRHWPAPEE